MGKLCRFILLGFVMSIFGCATLFTGTSDKVKITSSPSQAKVFINGKSWGITPLAVELERDKDYTIEVKKTGYANGTASFQRKFNEVALLNIVNLFGWIIDFATGGAWKFEQDSIHVTLRKK